MKVLEAIPAPLLLGLMVAVTTVVTLYRIATSPVAPPAPVRPQSVRNPGDDR